MHSHHHLEDQSATFIPFSSSDCANALMKNIVEGVAAAAFRLDLSFALGTIQAAVTISHGHHSRFLTIRTIILNSNTFRADEASGQCECDHNESQGVKPTAASHILSFPYQPQVIYLSRVVHNVNVSAEPRNRDLTRPNFRVARRAARFWGFVETMLCSAHHLFSASFAAAAFSMRGYAFAPSSGKSVSHIIPFSSSDCANALMKDNIEILAAAVFRLDASFDLGTIQAAVTISYGHTSAFLTFAPSY